jgi:hypothetical protein
VCLPQSATRRWTCHVHMYVCHSPPLVTGTGAVYLTSLLCLVLSAASASSSVINQQHIYGALLQREKEKREMRACWAGACWRIPRRHQAWEKAVRACSFTAPPDCAGHARNEGEARVHGRLVTAKQHPRDIDSPRGMGLAAYRAQAWHCR